MWGFFLDKPALRQVFAEYFVSPCQSHFTNFSTIIITREWHNRPICGRSAERTQLNSSPTIPIYFLINKQIKAYRYHDTAVQQRFPAPETSNHRKSYPWISKTALHNNTTALEPKEKLAFCHTRRRERTEGLRRERRPSTPFPEGQKEEISPRRTRGGTMS
jgi:hypothetical protein